MANLLHPPLHYEGDIFLHLEKPEFCDAWVYGGQVPLKSASSYLSDDRGGIFTPDEVRQAKWDEITPDALPPNIHIGKNATVNFGSMIIDNALFGGSGLAIYNDAKVEKFEEDAFIFCASTDGSVELMRRLNKVSTVLITDLGRLKGYLDSGIGSRSVAGLVSYTEGPDRGHFLKSSADHWQAEYRLAWPGISGPPRWTRLPAGIGRRVR